MNCLFWNVNKNENINKELTKIVLLFNCDLIALAEYKDDVTSFLNSLSHNDLKYYEIPQIGCKRITLFCKIDSRLIEACSEDAYYTIKRFPHKHLGQLNIAFVHFPSKLHYGCNDFTSIGMHLKKNIEKIEKTKNDTNTVIVGDFNMNPFESAMISANSLHAVSSRTIAKKISRSLRNQLCSYFYNPMWNLLGDCIDPPGSYYYYG